MGETGSGLLLSSRRTSTPGGGSLDGLTGGGSLDGLTEGQLGAMLETTFNYEERLKIRRTIRQLKKKKAEALDSSKIISETSSRKNRKESLPDGRKWSGSSYQREAELRTNQNSSSRSYTSARKKHNGESPSAVDTSPLKGNSEIIHVKANKNGSRNVERDLKVKKEKSSGIVESRLLTPGTGRGFEESKVSNRRKMDDIKSENIKNLGMGGGEEEDVSVKMKTEKLTDIIGLSLDVKRDINITEKSEKSKVNAVIVHENNAEENRREGNSGEEMKVEKSDKETCEEKISEMEEIERDGRQDKNEEEEEEEEEKEDVPRRVEVEVKDGDGDKDDSNLSVEIQATGEDRVGRGERDKDEGVAEMEHQNNADGEKDCDSVEDTEGGRGCVTVDSRELSRCKEARTGDGRSQRANTAIERGVRTSILDEEDNEKDKDCMEEDGVNIKSESVLKENKFKEGKDRFQRQTESEKKEEAIDRPKSLDLSEEEIKRVRGRDLEGGSVCESGGKLQESRTMERNDKSLSSEEVKERDEAIAGMEPEDEETKKEVKLEEIEDECLLREMLDSSSDFEERRRIRAVMRALKKRKKAEPTGKKPPVQQSYLNLSNGTWQSGRNALVPRKTSTPKMKKLNTEPKKQTAVLGQSNSAEMDSKHRSRTVSKPTAAEKIQNTLLVDKSISKTDHQTVAKVQENTEGKNRQEEKSSEVSELEASPPYDKSSVESMKQEGSSWEMDKSKTRLEDAFKSGRDESHSEEDMSSVRINSEGAAPVEPSPDITEEVDTAKRRRREWQRNLLRSYEDNDSSPFERSSISADQQNTESPAKPSVDETERKIEDEEIKDTSDISADISNINSSVESERDSQDSQRESESYSEVFDRVVDDDGKIGSVDSFQERSENDSKQGLSNVESADESLSVITSSDLNLSIKDPASEEDKDGSKKQNKEEESLQEDKSGRGDRKSEVVSKDETNTTNKSFKINDEREEVDIDISMSKEDVKLGNEKTNISTGKESPTTSSKSSEITESPKRSLDKNSVLVEKTNLRDLGKSERKAFVSSRWKEPKKANFRDIQNQFQSGFQKKNEGRTQDKALKGVRGKVSQAALRFSSPDVTHSTAKTTVRGTPDSPGRTNDRGLTDPKKGYLSKRGDRLETSVSDKTKNKAETREGRREDVSIDKETSIDRVQEEESPPKSIYMTPAGTPTSPDTFYTPKESFSEGSTPRKPAESRLSLSVNGETGLLHSKRVKKVEGDQQKKRTKVEEDTSSLDNEPTSQAPDIAMAPTVEQITDETTLEKMLEEATIFEDRKKIRARLRELRKQKRGGGGGGDNITPTPQDDMDTGDTTDPTSFTTERKRTRASALTVNTSSSQQSVGGSTTVEIKPSGTTTALSPVSPAAKTVRTDSDLTNDHGTKVETHDDGKTKTMTTTSVKSGPGMKSTQVTTMTKTDDKAGTKAATMKQETTTTKTENKPATGKPQSKFQQELEEKKKKRAEQQKLEQGKWKSDQEARRKAAYEKRKKEEEDAQKKKASLMDKFGGKATSVGPIGPKKTVAGGSTRMMVQNPATIKAKLLEWSQRCARGYPNVTIQNFSSSWCDGMAFCAVVHSYYPDAFDFNSLDPQNRRFNFDLAFDTAEKLADIYPLLETDDMIMMKNKPDWKCVFTYVQALYRGLHKAAGQVPS
ncbi:uncharacterized protein [Apostichopus japonicus]|uniref:uncharacterized protein isoform X3 n=1 Tax=Stichopus japonicus TaxID=307972 RepID=UPI003AB4C0C0